MLTSRHGELSSLSAKSHLFSLVILITKQRKKNEENKEKMKNSAKPKKLSNEIGSLGLKNENSQVEISNALLLIWYNKMFEI